MLHPSYADLIDVINSEAEGDKPLVQSRYSVVLAAAKRARQLIDGEEALIAVSPEQKPLSTAAEEIYEGKVRIVGGQDEEEAQ
ncbi:MAG: DNA-directed RNA polymerase subunit omega [Clostridiales bacterium]|nr:DNA-directed RNA polymerase subunit omega [Clostridiales bacterium]